MLKSMWTVCNYWHYGINQTTHKKGGFLKGKVNGTKDKRAHADEINLNLGKNECHRPSDLDSRLIVVIRQKGR